jgi:hypothetical protein
MTPGAGTWYISTGARIEFVDGRLHVLESLVSVHPLRAAAEAESQPTGHGPTVRGPTVHGPTVGADDLLSDLDHYRVTAGRLMPPRSSSQGAEIHDAGHDR